MKDLAQQGRPGRGDAPDEATGPGPGLGTNGGLPETGTPAAPPAQKPKDYRRAIDLLRFVAAAGIVLDHTLAWAVVGYTALGLFLILTSYFGVGSYLRSGGERFWSSRARRIAVPWLFWCAVYRLIWEVISDAPFQLLSNPFTLLIGPSIHLWFLPFAMLALVFIPTIARDVATVTQLRAASVVLAFMAVTLGLIHARAGLEGWLIPNGGTIPQPVPQWAYSLPFYIWGALASVGHRLKASWIPLLWAAIGSVILTLIEPGLASYQLILCAVIFEAVWRAPQLGIWATQLAGYAFGIYLMHPAFALLGYKLFGADASKTVIFLISFFGAWAGTWVFKRLPVLKGMV
ncbi:acyltransferase family protein [Xinfangfangia pollutisoli]|uniref:acyltransferase family protein n=1 Tax=Xinfangfangia pollutisoli TaxID=2865960 RepID=UPI001CD62D67|nr:acyltransferase [Xinfangfangia pollutisoli]